MGLSGLDKIAFFDDNDDGSIYGGETPTAGTSVQINDIKDGEGDIAILQPIEENVNPAGEVVYSGYESTIEVAVYDDNVLSQLREWQTVNDAGMPGPGRRIKMVGVGAQGLFWYEPTRVRVLPRNFLSRGTRSFRTVRMNLRGGDHGIRMGTNLLTAANEAKNKLLRGWYDADADGYADGVIQDGITNGTFDNSQLRQTFEVNNGGGGLYVDIPLPISGVDLTQRVYFYNYPDDGNTQIRIDQRNYDNNSIELSNYTLVKETPVLVKNTFETISNVYKLRIYPMYFTNNPTLGTVLDAEKPALRADGSTDWTP